MVTLQDVSTQLMKPAKDLAEWSFPLSQVLEKYYALLEQPCDINFGNAALVIENSANVYSRRVDALGEKTLDLNQIIQREKNPLENTSQNKSQKGIKKLLRETAYLDDFVLHDLNKEVGKNINLKDGSQKPVKLLTRRFPQLESSFVHLHSPIEIVDISGEVIGKKYDFRCSEYFDASGMLVYECTPQDFKHRSLDQGHNDTLQTQEDLDFVESGYLSHLSNTDCNDNFSQDCIDAAEFTEMPPPNNCCSSPIEQDSLDDINEAEISQEQEQCETVLTNDSGFYDENNSTIHSDREQSVDTDQSAHNQSDINCPIKQTESLTEMEEEIEKNVLVQPGKAGKRTSISDNDKDAGYTSCEENTQVETRRSKRVSCKTLNVRVMESKAWKPMPLAQGAPIKPFKKRETFKLPCHISALKTTSESRKRKIAKSRNAECIAKFYLNEFELPNKKVTMYSPTRQTFTPLKEEELEEFEKSFDDFFKHTDELRPIDYEAITNMTMDLLGFQPNYVETIRDTVIDRLIYSSDMSIPDEISPDPTDLPPYVSYSTPQLSPCSNNELSRDDSLPGTRTCSSDYENLIENRMKEVFQESDVRTDLEETIAEWHRLVQPKVAQAECRSPFRIREYGSRILESLKRMDRRRSSFHDIVQGQEPFEVARYFSASLQLANMHNVDIRKDNGHMELVLLRADLQTVYAEENVE